MTASLDVYPKSHPTTSHQRLVASLAGMPSRPADPAALAQALDARCGVHLDFRLYRYEQDLPAYRRELHRAVASMQATVGKLMARALDPRQPDHAADNQHDIMMPHDIAADQIVDLAITDPDKRRARGADLMSAIYTIALFPLRASLSDDAGRRPGDDSTIDVARAVRAYLMNHEGEDFGRRQVRADRTQIVWNKRASTMVGEVFDVLGLRPRIRIETIVKRVYLGACERHPLAA